MDSGQQCIRLFPAAPNNPLAMTISRGFKAGIRAPAVRHDDAARFDGLLDEADETLRGGILNPLQADSPDDSAPHLGRYHHQGLITHMTPAASFFHAAHEGLVHLDLARQAISAWTNHGPTEFMQPCPCRLVTAQTKYALKTQCVGAVFLARHPPHHLEPQAEWLACPVEDGAGCDRDLVIALPAVQQTALGIPGAGGTASWATEARWPTKPR